VQEDGQGGSATYVPGALPARGWAVSTRARRRASSTWV
jgi:hypothetical protein